MPTTTVIVKSATLRFMAHGKSLTPEQNDRVRAAVNALLEQYGSQGALALQLGLTQAGLSSFLSGRNGAGMQLVDAVSRKLRCTRDELLDGVPAANTRGPAVSDLPGWEAAEAAARSFARRPEWVWTKARSLVDYAPPAGEVTAEWVLELASFVHRNTPNAAQLDASAKSLDATIKAIETRAKNRIRSK